MAELIFPDGQKLSDYAKKAAFNVFTANQKISKADPQFFINNTTTTASSIVFQRSDSWKAAITLGTTDDLVFEVGAGKVFTFIVG